MSVFSWFFPIGQSKLGYLFLDVLVSESLSLPSKVTQYPVEDGDEDMTDHITANNEELTIVGSIASGSAFGMEFGSKCYSKMLDAIDQLRKMHKERKTVTVVTGLGKYEDMAFTNLSIDRNNSPNAGGQWLSINASLRKIRKVTLKEADLPPDKAAPGGGAAGKTGATAKPSGKTGTGGDGVPKSALYSPGVGHGDMQDIVIHPPTPGSMMVLVRSRRIRTNAARVNLARARISR